ncbi:helix-turn-helix domain-containing protein [Micromonospora sp. WMMD964]|uniref:TetR/AcrR family transcriptional regulator n=1 Tax=Micromonospora sp. WMMD964 TaxID=3016091 RepID=UPI00249BF7FC|nr:helix-turn-helix domain-containing protein [Micromonospora sp. WMMD964]WFF00202.1 helix-turn-helix domain containing protein [Micromonospora sp. WMMD964]
MRWDAEEKRQRILAAARRAFADKGADVTVARIARDAGVSVATVYRRFPTRDRLIADATPISGKTARPCTPQPCATPILRVRCAS